MIPNPLRSDQGLLIVETSCGYGVPMVSLSIDPAKIHEGPRAYLEDRQTLGHWAGSQIEKGVMDEYRVKMNTRSKDGCAGLKVARRQKGANVLLNDCWIWLRRTTQQREAMMLGAVLAGLLMVFSGRLFRWSVRSYWLASGSWLDRCCYNIFRLAQYLDSGNEAYGMPLQVLHHNVRPCPRGEISTQRPQFFDIDIRGCGPR